MERLLPKDDYYKTTTRRILGDREKQKIIEAVERASGYLNQRMSYKPFESITDSHDLELSMAYLRRKMGLLSQAVSLVKGSTQPSHLYRRARLNALNSETWKIAEETGADFREVQRLFLAHMNPFISDIP